MAQRGYIDADTLHRLERGQLFMERTERLQVERVPREPKRRKRPGDGWRAGYARLQARKARQS